ncbi:MAG TPA: hypothetical protein VGH04_14175 [Gemmatimonadaceae bacterium]|jgi:uncharacterized membrane protein
MSDDRESVRPEMLDRWLVRAAVAVVVTLQFSLIHNFSYGARWLAPLVELILLVPLTVLTLRAERLAWHAHTTQERESANMYRRANFALGMALVLVVSLANAASLLLLLKALLAGKTLNGRTLLLDALNVWATNVIVFSLWYWVLDRGGPWLDRRDHRGPAELIFPRMTLPAGPVDTDARPGYVDYLFLSFNTSTAFSPTDTMPLTVRMKLLMMLEATVSLLTLLLVAARAVNILA